MRVCDSCYALKAPVPTRSPSWHGHHHRSKKSTDSKSAAGREEDDLQRALRMSLEDAKPTGASGYVEPTKNVTPMPSKAAVIPSSEYEDPDMKAAIEASLRDMQLQQPSKAPEPALAAAPGSLYGGSTSIKPVTSTTTATTAAPVLQDQLTISEMENINLFSILVNHMQNEPRGAIIRDTKMQELYDNVTTLRPKFSRSVAESVGKHDQLLDMYQKLSTAVRYYDQMLEARLGYSTYGARHY